MVGQALAVLHVTRVISSPVKYRADPKSPARTTWHSWSWPQMLLLRLVGWRDKFRAAAEESWARTSTVLGYRHEDLIDPHVGPNPDVSTVRSSSTVVILG